MKKILYLLLSAMLITGCSASETSTTKLEKVQDTKGNISERISSNAVEETSQIGTKEDFSSVPDYTSAPFIYINNNQPYFSDEEKQQTTSKIELSELDSLGRCGTALEVIGTDILPTESRKDISSVYPTGWHQAQYGNVYVYNRTHLLGYAESGLNDEPRNLITGTSQMNQDVMTLFENDVREYVKSSGNHVVYRVTPDFKNNNLVANGVGIEAWSVEDNGQGICLNIYLYNVQDGVNIDYETGYTSSSDYIQEQLEKQSPETEQEYVVNKNTKKFHLPSCSNANRISDKNKGTITDTLTNMKQRGYEPAQCCIKD